jgi:hypothetical protein
MMISNGSFLELNKYKVFLLAAFLFGVINDALAIRLENKEVKKPVVSINLSQNKDGSFNGSFVNAPLRKVLNEISIYTDLTSSVLPEVNASYNLNFSKWSERKLIDRIVRNINNARVFSETEGGTKTKALFLIGIEDQNYKSSSYNVDIEKLKFNFKDRLSGIKGAKKQKGDILDFPEVITLIAMSKLQKQQDLFYQRLVNPNDLLSAYTFKVRYSEQHKMMIPFERNGKPEEGKAEGFMSFATLSNILLKKRTSLEALRNGKDLYIRFKDPTLVDTYMLLNGDASQMEVVQKVGTKGLPNMQVRLLGNQHEFTSLAEIQHLEGTIILADSVITQ